MTKFYLVDRDLPVRDARGFLNITRKQLENCIDWEKKNFLVFTNKEDAETVALDGQDENAFDQFPIFEIEYEGKGRATSYELEDENESIDAKYVPANKVTILSASLEHVSYHFKSVSFEVDSDDEEIDLKEEKVQAPTMTPVVTQTPSRTSRFLTGTSNALSTISSYLPRPSILVGGVASLATYYFEGVKQVAPSLVDNLRQSLPSSVPPVAADVAVALGTGLVAGGLTEGIQRAPKPSLHFSFGRKQNNATVNPNATFANTNEVEERRHAKLK